MIIDLQSEDNLDIQKFGMPTVIIGAGPVGIYLAHCLSKAGQSVLVVERGGRVSTSAQNEIATNSVGSEFVGHKLGRAFGVGGTSVVWGGQLAEFDRRDFSAWPIGYEDMRSWYQKVYKDLGVYPEDPAAYRLKLGAETAGSGDIERYFTHWLPQQNFARIFSETVTNNIDVPIIINGIVSDIKFENDRASSITINAPDGKELRIRGSQFVFCNGTFEILRFFLSKAKIGAVPWANNGMIGKKYQDHLSARVATAELLDEAKFRNYFENAIVSKAVKIHPKLRIKDAARQKNDLGISAYFSFRSDTQESLGNIKWLIRALRSGAQGSSVSTLPRDLMTLLRTFGPIAKRYVSDRRIMAFFDKSIDFVVQCEQRPILESEVRLSADPHPVPGLFGIEIDFRYERHEMMETISHFAVKADEYLQEQQVARLLIDDSLKSKDAAFIDTMVDVYHHAGGMCMSESPSEGAVDKHCRVWGADNVFVCGATVFPTSSHANTTFTALALTARLADELSRNVARSPGIHAAAF